MKRSITGSFTRVETPTLLSCDATISTKEIPRKYVRTHEERHESPDKNVLTVPLFTTVE